MLFLQGNYFHAVFEVAKVYNKAVKAKSHEVSRNPAAGGYLRLVNPLFVVFLRYHSFVIP